MSSEIVPTMYDNWSIYHGISADGSPTQTTVRGCISFQLLTASPATSYNFLIIQKECTKVLAAVIWRKPKIKCLLYFCILKPVVSFMECFISIQETEICLGECSRFLHWTNVVMHMILYSKEVRTMPPSCCKLSMHKTKGETNSYGPTLFWIITCHFF